MFGSTRPSGIAAYGLRSVGPLTCYQGAYALGLQILLSHVCV